MKNLLFIIPLLLTGCASIPLESPELTRRTLQFDTPPEGKAGLYVYRTGFFGAALVKDIWIDDKCLGANAAGTFFYSTLDAGQAYTLTTQSKHSTKRVRISAESGQNYFVKQYIEMQIEAGVANLELVSESAGKYAVSQLDMAKSGTCLVD